MGLYHVASRIVNADHGIMRAAAKLCVAEVLGGVTGACLAESGTKSPPMTIASLLNGGAALTGKSGRKSASAGDTSARQRSMHTAAHFMFAKIESRQSRVERKALVFFPTLNKRLSQFQR